MPQKYTAEQCESRFWERVDKTGDCWLWLGFVNVATGYGQMKVQGRTAYPHRYGYEIQNGPIPEGLQVDHLCRTRICVRGTHLESSAWLDREEAAS